MTKRMLQLNVLLVCVALAALIVAALLYPKAYAVLKDFAGVFVAIGAAYLAYCFQRRQSFLASLRELWDKCIEAKAELIEYTHDSKPDQDKFGRAHRALSTAIDMMRAVYRNVDETEKSIGMYPFESLHDMRLVLDGLGFQNVSSAAQHDARRKIMDAWNTFRWSFLREFSAPAPSHYVVDRGALDPRRAPKVGRAA